MAKKKIKPAAGAADANVEQIREIIFGANIREYEARFTALQGELAASMGKLRQELKAGLKALEKSIEGLTGALDDEASARRNDDESLDAQIQHRTAELAKDLDATESRLSGKVTALAKEQAAAQQELRRAIDSGNEDLEARVAAVAAVAAELSDRKVARDDLAGLLNELAARLSRTEADT